MSGSLYRNGTSACDGPTPLPTDAPTPEPSASPTLYPSPSPTTSQPTVKVILVTVSSQIELDGVSPDDIGKGEKIIIKRAISSATDISTENIYNLDFADVSTS